MSHTHFLIVSGKPATDILAKNIVEKCIPNSSNILASYGMINSDGDGYSYIIRDEDAVTYDDLGVGLTNHIAQFKAKARISNQTSELNLFFLDNPYGANDFDQTAFLKLMEGRENNSRAFNNVVIWRVVLGYDTSRPNNVCLTSKEEALKANLATSRKSDHVHTLYVDTCNLMGGTVFSNAEHHDFHLPRMLADFMLLASDASSAATIVNVAIPSNIDSNIFAIGHSECMYHAEDVQDLLRLNLNIALITLQLDDKDKDTATPPNDDDKLNYIVFPLGLRNRLKELRTKYAIQHNAITDDNISNEIDELIANYFARYFGDNCILGRETFSYKDVINAENNLRSANVEGSEENKRNATDHLNKVRETYNSTLEKISSQDFSKSLKKDAERAKRDSANWSERINSLNAKHADRGFMRRIGEHFSGSAKRRIRIISELEEKVNCQNIALTEIKQASKAKARICELLKLRERYYKLANKVSDLEKDLQRNVDNTKRFTLTQYDDTHNIVNLSTACTFFNEKLDDYRKCILDKYKEVHDINKAFEAVVASKISEYEHVNWRHPFEFIDVPNIGNLYGELFQTSLPNIYISSKTERSFERVRYFVFANSEQYVFQEAAEVSDHYHAYKSDALKDKICALQVVPLSKAFISAIIGEDAPLPPAIESPASSTRPAQCVLLPLITDTVWRHIKDHIPPLESQIGKGYKLIHEMKFAEAKRYFATIDKDAAMAKVCTILIKSKGLIDKINNAISSGMQGEMNDTQKEQISEIEELFISFGLSYAPLNSVVNQYLKQK